MPSILCQNNYLYQTPSILIPNKKELIFSINPIFRFILTFYIKIIYNLSNRLYTPSVGCID